MPEHDRDIAHKAALAAAAALTAAALSTGTASAAAVGADDVARIAQAQPESALGAAAARVLADTDSVGPLQNHNK
ncbi:hypothetical protein ACFC00_36590 [Streptomyces adustus]|uniref:hypothetical protein n=1 Tax=Streptomyces adustus TaxID=1609272 RepID=UPI0035DFB283